jgi:mRNA-degrading endonuclease YafQ of YafQ-DinJ toxin-antitoxin module
MEISLKLRNEDELLNLNDLLLPLNHFNNFIYELENLNILDIRFEKENNLEFLLKENRINRLLTPRNIRGKESFISVKKISKSSPTFLELFLNVAPYVAETIKLLIENEELYVESKIHQLLNQIESFKNCSVSKQTAIIRYILFFFRLLLGFMIITTPS